MVAKIAQRHTLNYLQDTFVLSKAISKYVRRQKSNDLNVKDVLCNNAAKEESKSILHMIRIAFCIIECNRITFTKAITCLLYDKDIGAYYCVPTTKENQLDVLSRSYRLLLKYVFT